METKLDGGEKGDGMTSQCAVSAKICADDLWVINVCWS